MSTIKHVVCPHCNGVNRVPENRLAQDPKSGVCHQALLDGRPLELSAPWCGPCKMMAPVFTQVAGQFSTRARFAKVNTEEQQALAARFGIRSIPTLAVFRGGREIKRMAGAMDAASLASWVQGQLQS